jgi:hypothetical protein
MGKIVYYTSKTGDCKPCTEINKLVEAGKFVSPDGEVDLVDITTDEGFERFNKEVLSKQDGAVPSAYLEGKPCQLILDDGKVFFECPSNGHPAGPESKSSPDEKDGPHADAQPGLPSESPEPQP